MVGMIIWVRSFTYSADGSIIKNADGPVFAAHPQPNLWTMLPSYAKEFKYLFELFQLPPASEGYGEGYSPFNLRSYASNWGTEAELVTGVQACDNEGVLVSVDLPYRQMSGSNKGPGMFYYGPNAPGNTTASWFQFFNNPGETMPPFVAQDDVPDPQGNYAFGTVRSYQNSIPHGVVEQDTTEALAGLMALVRVAWARQDDGKGVHAPSFLRIMNSQPRLNFYSEYFSGTIGELDWFVRDVMQYRTAVTDFAQYFHTQNACNNYDARYFSQGGYWSVNPNWAVLFVGNPDVATSWNWAQGGTISQQIAFNLMIAYAHDICLPCKMFLVYAEDYFSASPDYPTGKGLMPLIDNAIWFAKTFAIGAYEERWSDKDVHAYTRNGDGGSLGWSGGCLVVINFNTYDIRYLSLQTMWVEGEVVHNYSITGHNEYATVGQNGVLNIAIKANYLSDGQSYQFWAPIIP
jgi:alpha-amylase